MPLDPSDQAFPNESMRAGEGIAPPAEPSPLPSDVIIDEMPPSVDAPTNEPGVLDPEKMPSTSSIDHRIDMASREGATFGDKYVVKKVGGFVLLAQGTCSRSIFSRIMHLPAANVRSFAKTCGTNATKAQTCTATSKRAPHFLRWTLFHCDAGHGGQGNVFPPFFFLQR
jgi:hypothetical protein